MRLFDAGEVWFGSMVNHRDLYVYLFLSCGNGSGWILLSRWAVTR